MTLYIFHAHADGNSHLPTGVLHQLDYWGKDSILNFDLEHLLLACLLIQVPRRIVETAHTVTPHTIIRTSTQTLHNSKHVLPEIIPIALQ